VDLTVRLRKPHPKQAEFINSTAKRKVIRAGRRGGKTTGIAIPAVQDFLAGHRVLYATPTQDQVGKFWFEVKRALDEPISKGVFYKNETQHIIELPGTEQRIRAKTAWNADTLRGDYADRLLLDEYQMMSKDAWELVGAPMLLDNNGDAVFIYTTKRGLHHSKELFKKAQADTTGKWATFVFSSHDNPYLSRDALEEIATDMTQLGYRMESLAEEMDDDPLALWNRGIIHHVTSHPDLERIGVGVDPPGSADGAECGIIAAGIAYNEKDGKQHGYVIGDSSRKGTPAEWGMSCVASYNHNEADVMLGEVNYGGDMVEHTIRTVDGGDAVNFKMVRATRGKAVRAEPIAAMYEQERIHHVGEFKELEDEMCNWVPGMGMPSPNRIDALVWVFTELLVAHVPFSFAVIGGGR
jgi:phage terminase large subunit-like protein